MKTKKIKDQACALATIKKNLSKHNFDLTEASQAKLVSEIGVLYAQYEKDNVAPSKEVLVDNLSKDEPGLSAAINSFSVDPFVKDKKGLIVGVIVAIVIIAICAGIGVYAVTRTQETPPTTAGATEQPQKTQGEDIKPYTFTLQVDAQGWNKDTSTPVIAHIVGVDTSDDPIDFYHAFAAGIAEEITLDKVKGNITVTYIVPINKDGSTYQKIAEQTVKFNNDGKVVSKLPSTALTPISADKVSKEELGETIAQIEQAVEKGDETLVGEKGSAIVDKAKENAEAAPSVDKEELEKATEEAKEQVAVVPQPQQPTPSYSGGGTSSPSAPSVSGGSSASSGAYVAPTPTVTACNHTFVAQTQTIHHDAEYRDQQVPIYGWKCNCGAINPTGEHMQEHGLNGEPDNYQSNVVIGYNTQSVLIADAWDETITTGYVCSKCGTTR